MMTSWLTNSWLLLAIFLPPSTFQTSTSESNPGRKCAKKYRQFDGSCAIPTKTPVFSTRTSSWRDSYDTPHCPRRYQLPTGKCAISPEELTSLISPTTSKPKHTEYGCAPRYRLAGGGCVEPQPKPEKCSKRFRLPNGKCEIALREAVCPEGYVLRDGICTTVKIVRPTVSVFIVRPRILTFLLDSFKGFGGSDLLPYGSSRLPSQGFISAAEFEPRDKTESDKHNEPKKSEREENILEIKINQDGDMTIIRTETNKNPSDDEPTNSSDEPINAAEEQSTINTVEHNEEEPVNKVEQEKLINIAEEQGTINAAGEEEPINEEDDTKNTTEQEESINKGDDTKNTAEQEESINEDYDTKNTAEQEESINEDEEQGTINMAASQEKPDPAAGEENVKIDEQDPLENAIDETPIKMTIFEIDAEGILAREQMKRLLRPKQIGGKYNYFKSVNKMGE